MVPNIGECFDIHRNKWFNDHQMGVFIDRAGCTSHRLKRELLQEWREIRLELPRSWSKVMSVSSPPLVPEQIVTDDVLYYVVWNGKRACEARLDVLGARGGAGLHSLTAIRAAAGSGVERASSGSSPLYTPPSGRMGAPRRGDPPILSRGTSHVP